MTFDEPQTSRQPRSFGRGAARPYQLVAIALLLAATAVHAKIPEPDAIYFGKARHNGGALLIPEQTGDVVVIARLNGVPLAQASVQALSSVFVLKVPVDDGQAPRLSGTARGNERVRIYLRSTLLNVEYEATQSVTANGLVVPVVRGDLTETDLTVAADFGGMPEGYSGFGTWAQRFGLTGFSMDEDTDRDGSSNLQEFAAGTDPTNASDVFRILEVRRLNGVSSIKFGPILLSREYSIWCSDNLLSTSWQRIGTVIPNAPADFRWFDHLTPAGTPQLFYRLGVDVQ